MGRNGKKLARLTRSASRQILARLNVDASAEFGHGNAGPYSWRAHYEKRARKPAQPR